MKNILEKLFYVKGLDTFPLHVMQDDFVLRRLLQKGRLGDIKGIKYITLAHLL
jgi:hypothetical protein